MYVYFNPDTLIPNHVVQIHDPRYDPASNGADFIQFDDPIPFARMMIAKNPDGTFALQEKRDMPITLLASPIKLGSDAMFLGVPAGATITINGVAQSDPMDATGSLDFTPGTTGFYTIAFSLVGYMDWSETIEVVSGG